jgi:DNA mismatch repair protein MutL
MVGLIKVLDKNTINKIAAGEVIERPASIVKELVENSIDAKSSRVTIELERAGKKLIRVMDNGMGIASADLKVAFEKHSTSKISTIEDVYNLNSLGFRGEALASIAAVSVTECISSTGLEPTGRKIVIESGKIKSFTEIGCAKGTTIKVKDLFFNLPARRKYLKTDQTELAHITEIVTHLAIYYNNINFKLIHDGQEILNLPGTKNRLDNLVNIYGKELARELIPISLKPDAAEEQIGIPITIEGYIGKPSITRSDISFQSIYVNGRYVDSKIISTAIKEAYKTLVMKHRHPVVILFTKIAPEAVDVNIHPTKLQVRFENEEGTYRKILTIIKETLQTHNLIPEVKIANKPKMVSLKAITTLGVGKPGYLPSLPLQSNENKNPEYMDMYNIGITQTTLKSELGKERDSSGQIIQPGLSMGKAIKDQIAANDNHQGEGNQTSSFMPLIHPIGQILDTYIIAQTVDGMLIIDQHAASERIMYERIKMHYSDSSMPTQELLEPVALELSPREQTLLKTNLGTLQSLSFTIDEMGDNAYFVKGIPIILGRLQDPDFIHDMINDLIAITKGKEVEIIKEKMIQIMACKAAIKAGKPLTIPEIQDLLHELYQLENPYTCAHGRPTIISMTDFQLKKLFKRIV